jgi:hypothetical protein
VIAKRDLRPVLELKLKSRRNAEHVKKRTRKVTVEALVQTPIFTVRQKGLL